VDHNGTLVIPLVQAVGQFSRVTIKSPRQSGELRRTGSTQASCKVPGNQRYSSWE